MIERYISKRQQRVLCQKMLERCRRMRENESKNDLYYEKYKNGRKAHDTTGLIYSAFSPTNFTDDEITSVDAEYGPCYAMPQLHTDCAIIEFYTKGNKLQSNHIKDLCSEYNRDESTKRYFILTFDCDKDCNLKSLEWIILDENAKKIHSEKLYDRSSLDLYQVG